MMKWFMLATVAGTILSGCATYRGGTADEYYYSEDAYGPGQKASPSFRPGMDPRDIRDPNALSHPLPPQPAPTP